MENEPSIQKQLEGLSNPAYSHSDDLTIVHAILHIVDIPNDFKRMCRSCYCKYDKKHLNFKGKKGERKCGA